MSRLRHVGMGFEDRAKARRRAGLLWIEGAAMAVVSVLLFYAYAFGLGLDEDPTTGVPGVFWAVIPGGLIAAAVMLRRGIMLVRTARRQLKRQQEARERARRKR
jgi:hypothetical protein